MSHGRATGRGDPCTCYRCLRTLAHHPRTRHSLDLLLALHALHQHHPRLLAIEHLLEDLLVAHGIHVYQTTDCGWAWMDCARHTCGHGFETKIEAVRGAVLSENAAALRLN